MAFDIDRDYIATLIVQEAERYVGQNETDGPNRSELIDTINKNMKANLGSPYCQSGIYFVATKVCEKIGFRNPLPKTPSTQDAWRSSHIKYKRGRGSIGDFCYWQSKRDETKGHAGICRLEQTQTNFRTIEFNTDSVGSREGGGVWYKSRNTVGTESLFFLGFVDVAQWILDENTSLAPDDNSLKLTRDL